MGMHSSGIGKFVKKDPNHGGLWRKIKHWFCRVGAIRGAVKNVSVTREHV